MPMTPNGYQKLDEFLAEEERTQSANEALCASRGHAEPFQKMYVVICSRCRVVLEFI